MIRRLTILVLGVLCMSCGNRPSRPAFSITHDVGMVYIEDGDVTFTAPFPVEVEYGTPRVLASSCGCLGAEAATEGGRWIIQGRLRPSTKPGSMRYRVMIRVPGTDAPSCLVVTGYAAARLAAFPPFVVAEKRSEPLSFDLRGTSGAVASARLESSTRGLVANLEEANETTRRVTLNLQGLSDLEHSFRLRIAYEDDGRRHVLSVLGSIERTSRTRWAVNPCIARMPSDGSLSRLSVQLRGVPGALAPGSVVPSNVPGVSGTVMSSSQGEATIELSIDWGESRSAQVAHLSPPTEAEAAGPLVVRLWRR